jgi:uncharacterized protein
VKTLSLALLPDLLAVCRLDPSSPLPSATAGGFWSLTRTAGEISVVLPEDQVQPGWKVEAGWRAFQVAGPLDFSLTGILASLARPLAEAGIPVFVLSTFDTDYLLVKKARLEQAKQALVQAGHTVG